MKERKLPVQVCVVCDETVIDIPGFFEAVPCIAEGAAEEKDVVVCSTCREKLPTTELPPPHLVGVWIVEERGRIAKAKAVERDEVREAVKKELEKQGIDMTDVPIIMDGDEEHQAEQGES